MKVTLNAAFVTDDPVGISRYVRCLSAPLARLCDLTILTSAPESFVSCPSRIIEIPRWTRSRRSRLIWTLTRLNSFVGAGCDILLCPDSLVPPSPRVPALAVVHDLIPITLPRLHSARHKALFLAELTTLRWASAAVADSHSTARDLRRLRLLPEQAVSVVQPAAGITANHGCVWGEGDAALSAEAASGDSAGGEQTERYVLYVGGHSIHKNTARLVSAFAELDLPDDIKLYMVGWGRRQDISRTRRAIDAHGISDRVTLMPRVSDSQLSLLYRKCLFFVFPSLYEGFGLPVLEALGHGVPTACSRAASLPEVAADAALYFNPRSTAEMTSVMQRLADDAGLRERLSALALKRSRKFSWQATAEEIMRRANAIVS